jgi:hypothetical protein
MLKMYFDPDTFTRISESVKQNPCPHRPYKLAIVDSFALFMLLQLQVKGDALGMQETTLDVLRPVIAKSDNPKKNKDIVYLLQVLKGSGMIDFDMVGKKGVRFTLIECTPTKLSAQGEPRSLVMVKRCNRHVLEDYQKSNVPFAIYCLLRSVMRVYDEDSLNYIISISFDEICDRLHIPPDTLNRYKNVLEEDGYIWTIKGKLQASTATKTGFKREVNEYKVFDYDHRKAQGKIDAFRLRKQEWDNQKERIKRPVVLEAVPTDTALVKEQTHEQAYGGIR